MTPTICDFGIMGTRYGRPQSEGRMLSDTIPKEIELVIGYGSYVLMLPHIEAIYPIGNTLNIEAR